MAKKTVKKTTKRAVKGPRKQLRKAPKPQKTNAKTKKTQKAPKFRNAPARIEGNPYRPNTSYGAAVDILAGHPDGMTRQALVEELAKVTRKPTKNCGYDVAVVVSVAGKPHPSARRAEGFTIERVNDNIRLVRPGK
jgi:hypothetical protein